MNIRTHSIQDINNYILQKSRQLLPDKKRKVEHERECMDCKTVYYKSECIYYHKQWLCKSCYNFKMALKND